MSAFNTSITLFRGVPLDDTYSVVFYEQNMDFYGFLLQNFTYKDYTNYSQVRDDTFRVYIDSETSTNTVDYLKTFNYMSFKNHNNYTNNKRFFGFIKNVKYINDNCIEVSYIVDYWHTYINNITFKDSYINRCHASTDNFGDNVIPEPLTFNCDYNYSGSIKDNIINQYMYVLVTNEGTGSPNEHDGVYSPCKYSIYHADAGGVQALTDMINNYNITPDKIVNLYLAPSFLLGWDSSGGVTPVMDSFANGSDPTSAIGQFNRNHTRTVTHASAQTVLNTLNLQNQKTFTAPFCFFNVNNGGAGQSMDLRYEYFDNGTPELYFEATYVSPVKCVCKPHSYKGYSSNIMPNESISLDNYPTCAYQNDAYMNWLVNAGVPIVAQGALSAAGGGGVGTTVTSFAGGAYKALNSAPILSGNVNSGNVNVAHKEQTFYTACKHLPVEVLKNVDAFFTRYGYQQNTILRPNLNARQKYTYIQSDNIEFIGPLSNPARLKIKDIFKAGVTIWLTSAYNNFGDYSTNPI